MKMMMKSKNDIEWEPVSDVSDLIGRVVEMEAEGTTLAQLAAGLGKGARVTEADRLLRLCGSSYAEFLGRGFAFEDLGEVLKAVFDALGFTARPSASKERTERRS